MAKLSAHGTELYRYFSTQRHALIANMSDGTTLYKSPWAGTWKVLGRKKPEVSMETWREHKQQAYDAAPAWAKKCKSIPSLATLQRWESDGVCDTPTGHTVEPDGEGPDGVPSWLVLLGVI